MAGSIPRPFIPRPFIEELNARSDLLEVVGTSVSLTKKGKDYWGLCPFHNEKSPSFSVSPDKQFYYCFGCGASGNALNFLMEHDHLDFIEAVEELARLQGVEVPREKGRQSSAAREREQQQKSQNEQRLQAMQQASAFFRQQLEKPEGLEGLTYLQEKRGLDAAIQERFALGLAPDAWDALKNHLLAAGISEEQQLELGLVAQKEGTGRVYDRFRHRVIFPIRNVKGQVIAFGGRVLDDSKPKYLNSPETPLFHKGQELYGLYEARKAPGALDKLLVVEGYMDVVALAQQGIAWSVATLGTATSTEHLKRIYRLVNEVIFCFDGDAPGVQAAQRALQSLLPLLVDGRHARFLFLPQGEDPDSLVRKEGAGLFEQRVHSALPVGEFLLQQLQQGLDVKQIDGQTQLAERARQPLQSLPEGLFKIRFLKSLTRLTEFEPHHLLSTTKALETPVAKAPAVRRQEFLAASPLEKLFRLLCRYPALAQQVPDDLEMTAEQEALLPFFQRVLASMRQEKIGRSPQTLLAYWTGTDEGAAILRCLQQAPELDAAAAAQEVEDLCARLQARQGEKEKEQHYQQLLQAAQTSTLSPEEHQQLMQLMRQLPPSGG